MAVPDTSIAGHLQSGLDGAPDECRYSAPEVQWYDDGGREKVLITRESDVYGMAMVVYEVSSAVSRKPAQGLYLTSIS